MKFLGFAAAALAAVGMTNAQTPTVAPTPAPTTPIPCVPLNITAKKADITTLNGLIDTINSNGLLKDQLVSLDPLSIVENRLSPIPFSIVGIDFQLTPIIKSLNATGIAKVVPEHINITSDTSLAFSAVFNGSIEVDASLSFEIQQLNKKWWQICWTSLDAIKCPPSQIPVNLGVGLVKPRVAADLNVVMQLCPKGVPRTKCADVTITNIIAALVGDVATKFKALLARILTKLTSAEIKDFQVGVDSVSRLEFSLPGASLLDGLLRTVLKYSVLEVNKKEKLYNDIISTVNTLGKQLLNQLIQEKLAPQFGNQCYTV